MLISDMGLSMTPLLFSLQPSFSFFLSVYHSLTLRLRAAKWRPGKWEQNYLSYLYSAKLCFLFYHMSPATLTFTMPKTIPHRHTDTDMHLHIGTLVCTQTCTPAMTATFPTDTLVFKPERHGLGWIGLDLRPLPFRWIHKVSLEVHKAQFVSFFDEQESMKEGQRGVNTATGSLSGYCVYHLHKLDVGVLTTLTELKMMTQSTVSKDIAMLSFRTEKSICDYACSFLCVY